MAKTATQLKAPGQLANVAATVFTTPTGLTIIRYIHVINQTASSVSFTMSLGADSATTRIFDAYPISAFTTLDFFTYHVVASGVTVQAFASSASALNLTVDGDVITLG